MIAFSSVTLICSILFFLKRSTLRRRIVSQSNGYNNTSKNKTLVEAVPMLSFAIANLMVFSFFLLITDEMESKHPWLYLIKDLPIHVLWGLTAPLAIYLLNEDARKHATQLYMNRG